MDRNWVKVIALCVVLAGPAVVRGAEAPPERPPYRIGIEDVLDIQVWKNADVSRRVWVRPDGRITIPLVGEVVAEGLTLQQLGDVLTERLKEYYTDPVVTVSLQETNSYVIYLLGRIKSPGAKKLRSPKTFLQLLAMAGGFQEFADTDNVVLVRWKDGKQMRIPIDAERILTKGEGDFIVRPGDVIVVP